MSGFSIFVLLVLELAMLLVVLGVKSVPAVGVVASRTQAARSSPAMERERRERKQGEGMEKRGVRPFLTGSPAFFTGFFGIFCSWTAAACCRFPKASPAGRLWCGGSRLFS